MPFLFLIEKIARWTLEEGSLQRIVVVITAGLSRGILLILALALVLMLPAGYILKRRKGLPIPNSYPRYVTFIVSTLTATALVYLWQTNGR
jgi:hypothetical protein